MESAVPRVTIGLTCHNAQDTIVRALRSAMEQNWPDLEILIVDDFSTDQSVARIREIATADPRIRLIGHRENKGYPAALNTLLREASGTYIAFFDDDDESAPDRIHEQVSKLQDFESSHSPQTPVFCYTNRAVVRPGTNRPDHITRAIGRTPPEPYGADVADFLLWEEEKPGFTWGAFGSCTLMARKAFFMQFGGFDESFRRCAEWDLAIRAALSNAWFIAVDKPLVTQYKTPSLEKSGRTPLLYALKLREKHKDYLLRRRMFLASQAMAYSRFYYACGRAWPSRFFRVLGCLMAPHLLLKQEFKRRVAALSSRFKDTLARTACLAPYLGGWAQAILYLARAKIDPGFLSMARYRGRSFAFRRCDVLAIREVLHHQEYAFLRPLLKETDRPTIIDIGAHIGLFALWSFCETPQARVLSIEASPSTFRILDKNVKKNADLDWRALHRAAWKDGESVHFLDEGEGMSRRICSDGTARTEGISLPSIFQVLPEFHAIDLMKIDIEGAEEAFLCSAQETAAALGRIRALVIELHPNACNTARVETLLSDVFPRIKRIPGRKSSKPLLFCYR